MGTERKMQKKIQKKRKEREKRTRVVLGSGKDVRKCNYIVSASAARAILYNILFLQH